jgi:hypothetical protein
MNATGYQQGRRLCATSLRADLDMPLCSPPPNGGAPLRLVQGEKKAL